MAHRDYPLSATPPAFNPGEKGAIRAFKRSDKLKAKANMKSNVADIKYTKSMREMSGKEARTAIRGERSAYRDAKKQINRSYGKEAKAARQADSDYRKYQRNVSKGKIKP